MAKTFEQLKASVADWLGIRDADSNRLPPSIRGDAINMKQKELLRTYDFRFMETDSTITTASGDRDYALPSDFSRPFSIQFQKGVESPIFLEQVSMEEFDIRHPLDAAAAYSSPLRYAIWGSQVFLGPTPDAIYTVRFRYYKELADLVDGAPNNTNDLISHAWDVLLWMTLADATIYGIEDPRIAMFKAKADDAVQKLVVEHARSRTAGRRPIAAIPGGTGGG